MHAVVSYDQVPNMSPKYGTLPFLRQLRGHHGTIRSVICSCIFLGLPPHLAFSWLPPRLHYPCLQSIRDTIREASVLFGASVYGLWLVRNRLLRCCSLDYSFRNVTSSRQRGRPPNPKLMYCKLLWGFPRLLNNLSRCTKSLVKFQDPHFNTATA